jgi:hypothetical protein
VLCHLQRFHTRTHCDRRPNCPRMPPHPALSLNGLSSSRSRPVYILMVRAWRDGGKWSSCPSTAQCLRSETRTPTRGFLGKGVVVRMYTRTHPPHPSQPSSQTPNLQTHLHGIHRHISGLKTLDISHDGQAVFAKAVRTEKLFILTNSRTGPAFGYSGFKYPAQGMMLTGNQHFCCLASRTTANVPSAQATRCVMRNGVRYPSQSNTVPGNAYAFPLESSTSSSFPTMPHGIPSGPVLYHLPMKLTKDVTMLAIGNPFDRSDTGRVNLHSCFTLHVLDGSVGELSYPSGL